MIPFCWTALISYEGPAFTYPCLFSFQLQLSNGASQMNNMVALNGYQGDISTLQLTVHGKPLDNNADYGKLQLGIMTDVTDTNSFVSFGEFNATDLQTTSQAMTTKFNSVSITPAEIYYPAIKYVGSKAGKTWIIDDILLEIIPNCAKATQLEATNISTNSATISWQQEGSSNTWTVYYKKSAESDDEYLSKSVSSEATTELSDLDGQTSYDVYVVTECGPNSPQSSVYTFKTLCSFTVVTDDIPYQEDFSSAIGEAPDCWINNGWEFPGKMYHEMDDEGITYEAISPTFDISGLTNPWLKITHNSPSWEDDAVDTLEILYRNSLESEWNSIISYYDILADFKTDSIALPNPSATYQIKLKGKCGGWEADGQEISFIKIYNEQNPPLCLAPTVLTISNITEEGATITWTQEGSDDLWEVYYKKSNEYSYQKVEVTGEPTYQLTGLTQGTYYDIYVATLCSGSDDTLVTKPLSFNTNCGVLTNNDIPYNADFNNVNDDGMPLCWSRYNNVGEDYPYTGSMCLYFYLGQEYNSIYGSYSYFGKQELAILPGYSGDITKLQLSVSSKPQSSTASGSIQLGVLTDIDDPSSFVIAKEFAASTWNIVEYKENVATFDSLQFATLPTIYYPAVRVVADSADSSHFNWMVNDITLEFISNCAKATDVVASNIEESSAKISWTQSDGVSSWNVYYKKASETEYTLQTVEDTPSTELMYLESGTVYHLYVETNCGTENKPVSKIIEFKTLCSAITISEENTYIENFNSYTADNGSFPDCWINVYDKIDLLVNKNQISEYGKEDKGLSLFIADDKTTAIVAMPKFTNDLTDLRIQFYKKTGSSNSGNLEFGYMTDVKNINTFVTLKTYQPEDKKWHWEKINLDDYTEQLSSVTQAYLAFRHSGNTGFFQYFWTLDSVVVQLKPDCVEPDNVTVSQITSTSAKLTWTSNASAFNINIVSEGQSIDSITGITEKEYSFTNLTPNINYTAIITGVCTDNSLTESATISFATTCAAVTISDENIYFEDFNTYIAGNNVMPNCWNNVWDPSSYSDYKNHVDASGQEGNGFSLQIATGKEVSIVTLPKITNNLTDLRVQFYRKAESTYSTGVLEFGYMTNLNDTSTFVSLKSYQPENYAWNLDKIDLDTYSEQLNGVNNVYPAFRHSGLVPYANYYWMLDSVIVKMKPACVEPNNLVVSNITATSAKLTWNSNASSFNIDIVSDGQTINQFSGITSTEYLLSNLTASTLYSVTITGVCNDSSITEATNILFTTPCCGLTKNDLPKFWDFESDKNGGTISYPLPTCWNRAASYNYPRISDNNTAYSGNYYLYNAYNATNTIAILQNIDTSSIAVKDLQISFYAKNYNNGATGLLEIGVMTDPQNEESFDVVDSIEVIGNSYVLYETSFASYTGEGTYPAIRFYPDQYVNASIYLDDLTIDEIPNCIKIKDATIQANLNDATVTLIDVQENVSYNVYYRISGEETWSEAVPVSNNIANITNLISGTYYELYIETVCGEGDSAISKIFNFKTVCNVIKVTNTTPWEEDFSNDNTLTCWTIGNGKKQWQIKNGTLWHDYLIVGSSDIVTPVIDLSEVAAADLIFDYNIHYDYDSEFNKYHNDSLTLFYRSTESANWTELASYTTYGEGKDTINLPNLSETYQINFLFKGGQGNGIDIDNLKIIGTENSSICKKPTNTQITEITANSIAISWNGEAASYDLQITGSEIVNTTNTSYTFNNLTPNTTYTIQLRGNCGTTVSDWVSLTVKTSEEQQNQEPVVTTNQATATQTTATLNGTVNKGTATIAKAGFKYRKAGENNWTNEVEAEIAVSGLMTKEITDLTPNTDYEFKAFVITAENKEYTGEVVAFKTKQSSLTDAINNISIVAYPNPTTHNATLKVEGLNSDAKVILTDVQGRVINSQTITQGQNEVTLNTENLTSGVYYIKVVGEGINKTQSLIKK